MPAASPRAASASSRSRLPSLPPGDVLETSPGRSRPGVSRAAIVHPVEAPCVELEVRGIEVPEPGGDRGRDDVGVEVQRGRSVRAVQLAAPGRRDRTAASRRPRNQTSTHVWASRSTTVQRPSSWS